MTRSGASGFSAIAILALAAWGCGAASPDECSEDVRAFVSEERAMIAIGDDSVEFEIARTPDEIARGLRYRECGLTGMALVPAVPQELLVDTCAVRTPLDIAIVAEARVVASFTDVEPCMQTGCRDCPIYGEGIVADAVLEWPSGAAEVEDGASVAGLPRPE